jgi:thioredoxin 1
VRTQGEFRKGFIEGAMNYDINSRDFKSHVSALDKSKPVFVYCLTGGRSAKAAAYLRRTGFKEVYELKGGMMAWNGAKQPVVKLEESAAGMSVDTFRQKIEAENLVLVDFHAKWCAPCKQMAPYLNALQQEYGGQMTLLKIDADANRALVDELAVQALPTLYLYKDGKEVWSHIGYLTKEQIEQKLKAHL